MSSLLALPDAVLWSSLTWTELASPESSAQLVAVLPWFGFADWGLGRPLDLEETLGTAVLREALARTEPALAPIRVLPPLRFTHGPYPHCAFGLDFETTLDVIHAIVESVRRAGVRKLVWFNTSPWNEELAAVAGVEARMPRDLHLFSIRLAALGLDLHPLRAPSRSAVHAAACACHGTPPRSEAMAAEISWAEFRPGHVRHPGTTPLAIGFEQACEEGRRLLRDAGHRLAGLLAEIAAYPERSDAARPPAPAAPPPSAAQSAGARAAPPDAGGFPAYRGRYLPAMTRAEIVALPDRSSAVVVVPTGAVEQHGPHLPLGVDAVLGQAVLARALAELPADAPVYVAPPVTYGTSIEHAGFPGTITISARGLYRVLQAIARQLQAFGFRSMAVLNTHGGNSAVVTATLREIQTELGMNAAVVAWTGAPELDRQEAAWGFHAGQWETSLMLAIAPHLVRMDRAVVEYPARLDDPGELRPERAPATFAWVSSDLSRTGVMGDATRASASDGEKWLQSAAAAVAGQLLALSRAAGGRKP